MRKAKIGSWLARLRVAGKKAFASPYLYAALAALAIVGWRFYPEAIVALTHAREDVSYGLHPSAQLAYEYGEAHFSAAKPGQYDLPRARKFLLLAAEQDPSLPYVYHELARIEFLNGHFASAMAYINVQIERQGDKTPNSYYIRGLIEGFEGDYADSINDYAHFLRFDPNDWAAMNDYAWVLMKDGRYEDAAAVTERGLVQFPNNAWLLNSSATALYQLGDATTALERARRANQAVQSLTPESWSHAYPGNDPGVAGEGLAAFKAAVAQNMHIIETRSATSAVQ